MAMEKGMVWLPVEVVPVLPNLSDRQPVARQIAYEGLLLPRKREREKHQCGVSASMIIG
jgi:hypothetical protein